ncbi:ribosomal protein L7/L12 [Clostridium estertheticum]|uniref:50S ribosomal protein L7/L12 n=1 Tax=Clostridium estertheticum TaxID=238834 RepID=A0A7Y3SYF0_9CLOT|nr:ribosomal protein L7/L12 [Clostridium estertheticum]MBW9172895.1 ribosomal protein L7/L12 [Clostridium estertheticum]NNU77350.1 50S ribosomal protein L7/L12 [Clostridium estertheticum]WBL47085.1 ribosomal protein L7/L12 [Clostridium estertheticum]WLC75264.1 ribosomal protein L7/L12 [Clostridium estertheticum]
MDYIILCVIILYITIIANKIDLLQKRITHMNSNLIKIAKQIGVPKDPLDDELKIIMEKDGKIKAIKKCREVTGFGLKEAKDYVDNLK